MKKIPVMLSLSQDEASAMRAGMPEDMGLSEIVRRFSRLGLAHMNQLLAEIGYAQPDPPALTVEPRAPATPEPPAPAVDLTAFLNFAYPLATYGEMTADEIVDAWGDETKRFEVAG